MSFAMQQMANGGTSGNYSRVQLDLPTKTMVSLTREQPQSPPRGLSTRSCHICRRRKVKCDKEKGGCGNCRKASIECEYPGPGRAQRRPKIPKPTSDRETELLKRLRRLENVVVELGGHVALENVKGSTVTPRESTWDKDGEDGRSNGNTVRVVGIDEGHTSARSWSKATSGTGGWSSNSDTTESDFGKIIVDEGKSRYVGPSFWASLTEEVAHIRELFESEGSSDAGGEDDDLEDSDPNTDFSQDGINHHGFLLGYSSTDVDLRSLHPLPSQIPFYFETFTENVDPLIKIFHIPTMSRTMKEVKDNLGSLSKSTEALCFSIYYITITSMTAEEVKSNFGVDKASLLKKYRFATEQALARAQFLNTSEIVTLQAFVLFLASVRRYDNTRFAWSMTGLAIRMAQSLGLHRDGTRFGLTPFDTEMRRRLWWQVAILDIRTAEDYGIEPSILEQSFDTKVPLNINDADLDPSATELPTPRVGVTEMTFCQLRFEICSTARKLSCLASFTDTTLADREKVVRDCRARLEKIYLMGSGDSRPLVWMAATIGRLFTAKLELMIYLGTPGLAEGLPQPVKDRLFITSIEIMEYHRTLEHEPSVRKWGWLFHTCVQWHAMAYILNQILAARYNADLLERGWRAVTIIFKERDEFMRRNRNTALWTPLRQLILKVKRLREQSNGFADQNDQRLEQPFATNIFVDHPSAPPAFQSGHAHSNTNRQLQQGAPQAMSEQVPNFPAGQVLNGGLKNNTSQFNNQQFGQNYTECEPAVQHQEPDIILDNSMENLDWLAGSGFGAMNDAAFDMETGIWSGVDETDELAGMSLESYEEMVKGFQMQVDATQLDAMDPVIGDSGKGNWW